jgi:hypothetical protein
MNDVYFNSIKEKILRHIKDINTLSKKMVEEGELSSEVNIYYIDGRTESFFDEINKEIVPLTKVQEDESLNFKNVIITNDLNLSHIADEFNFKNLIDYGLSDSMSQVLKEYDPESHIFTFYPIVRKHQPPMGGFRFHKWGEYIGIYGDEVDKCEYIYDSNIEFVWVFSVFLIKNI